MTSSKHERRQRDAAENIPGSREVIAESPFVIQEPEKCKGNWNIVFQNDHPVHIEVGMGKDGF